MRQNTLGGLGRNRGSFGPVAAAVTDDIEGQFETGPNSQFVEYHAEIVFDDLLSGTARVGTNPPGAIGTSVTVGKVYEPPDLRRLVHDATVNYRIVRGGDPESWASGLVTAKDTVTEDALVSQLMDQIASRAASELHKPHPSTPE